MSGKRKISASVLTSLKSDHKLVVLRDYRYGILKYGRDNKYPNYLLKLYKEQPTHGSIINKKTLYLTGLGVKPKSGNPGAVRWLEKANHSESWEDLSPKINKDKTIYGAFAIKVIPNLLGSPLCFFHLDWGKIRLTECGTKIKYSEDWCDLIRYPIQEFPVWYPGCKEVGVYLWKTYNPSVNKLESEYPSTEYDGAIMDIDTEVRVSNFFNSLVINGFSAATVITIFGGKPETEEEEKAVVNTLLGRHEGDEKAGRTAIIWSNEKDKGAEVNTVNASDLDKQFQEVSRRNTRNIYSAHDAPAELFSYLSDTTSVFDVSHIVDQNELFMNAYVIPKQKVELDMLAMFYKLATGQEEEFEKEQFKPIGLDLPLDQQPVVDALNNKDPNIILNWLNKKYALEIQMPEPGQVGPAAAPVQQEVNDHLKNLTGKQTQGIMRIVKKYKSGEYNEQQAKILLKSGFGLTDEQVREFLGMIPQAVQQRVDTSRMEKFFSLLDKYAVESENDEVLETFMVKTKFAEAEVTTDQKNAVLNQIKANPSATVANIAGALGLTAVVVAGAITWLTSKGLVEGEVGSLLVTEKGLSKDPEIKTEIYTEYNYVLRSDVPGPVVIPGTRDFCREMLKRYGKGKKALTFEAIEDITNEFGEDAWSYRGGFWHNPATGETEPSCRHAWAGTVKIRRKKK